MAEKLSYAQLEAACRALSAENKKLKQELEDRKGQMVDFPINITPEAVDKISIKFIQDSAKLLQKCKDKEYARLNEIINGLNNEIHRLEKLVYKEN